MRKFIPAALAVAIVMVAAVAILTSNKALSFSLSPDSNAAPAPLYSDDVQGYYHFGPDFMCLINDGGTIECLGSDAHGVVSNAPSLSGFTEIAGGDTYACAYHDRNNFDYCWGSIDRQPSNAPDPTPTEVPTATPEPTATALPPGATPPAATATVVPTATAVAETDPCELAFPDNAVLPVTLTGSWVDDAECLYPVELDDFADGDRYHRWTGFVATVAHSPWTATLESDEDTFLLLFEWDDDDEIWNLLEKNDDIVSGNTNSRISWTPTQGKSYLLDLTTYNADTLGDFTLTIGSGTSSTQSSANGQSMEQSKFPSTTPLERRQ